MNASRTALIALIGAALPITQYENRIVGPARDRTLARAKEVGQREYENLKQAMSSSRASSQESTSSEASNQPSEGT